MTNITALFAILSGLFLFSVAQNDCATETAFLVANALVQGAFQDVQNAILSDLNGSLEQVCSIDNNLGCFVDFSGYSNTFVTVCQAANGTVTTQTVSIGCTGSFNDVTIPVDFQLAVQNVPACIGNSCDPNNTDIPEEIQSNIENARIQVVDTIASLTGGTLQCQGDASPAAIPSPVMSPSLAPMEEVSPTFTPLLTPVPSVILANDTVTSAPVVAPVAPIAAPVSPDESFPTSSSPKVLNEMVPLLVVMVASLVVWI